MIKSIIENGLDVAFVLQGTLPLTFDTTLKQITPALFHGSYPVVWE